MDDWSLSHPYLCTPNTLKKHTLDYPCTGSTSLPSDYAEL